MNRNDRTIVGLVALAHAMVHTYELSIPILIPLWLEAFPVERTTVGAVVAVGYALFGLGALPGGVLSDSLGSRRLIAACLFGMAGSFALLAAAPSLPVVALALVCWGAAASVYHPSGLSLISTGVEDRGNAFAYHGIAGNLGTALGPLAVALLLLVADWRAVTAALAVPAVVAGAVAVRVRFDERAAVVEADGGSDAPGDVRDADEDATGGESKAGVGVSSFGEFCSESKLLLVGPFAAVFLVVMLDGLYYRGVLTFLPDLFSTFSAFAPVEFAGRKIEPHRYAYAGLLMVGVLGQYVGGKLTERVSTERAMSVALLALAALALVFLPAANAGLLPLVVVGALLGFTLFVVQPLYQATVAAYTPPGTRGLSYGYTYLGVFGVGALGAALAGVILQYADATALFTVLAALAVAGAVTAGVLGYR